MKRFGLFRLGALRYALDVVNIARICQDARTYPWPRLPEMVSTILVANNRLIPVLDLQRLFQQGSVAEPQSVYQVLIKGESGSFALPADLNARIVAADKGALRDPADAEEDWCGGYFDYQETRYSILDVHFIEIGMTQRIWRNQPDSGARRTQ